MTSLKLVRVQFQIIFKINFKLFYAIKVVIIFGSFYGMKDSAFGSSEVFLFWEFIDMGDCLSNLVKVDNTNIHLLCFREK